jgi:Na+-driven multidrug efflux pump
MTRNRTIRNAAVVVLLLVIAGAVAHACPNCGLDVLEGQKGGESLAKGFTYSMVGMASAPFLVFTSLATYIYRKYRQRP